jgi:hypothetical protein
MGFRNSEAAAILTAAVIQQQKVPMTVEGAEQIATFHKHVVFFLNMHLPEHELEPGAQPKVAPGDSESDAGATIRSSARRGR